MRQTFLARARFLLLEADIEPAEFGSAAASLLWGIIVLNPYEDTFVAARASVSMARLAPEWVWGATFLLLGVVQLLFWGVAAIPRRRFMALIMFCVWTAVWVLFMLGYFWSTATAIYPLPIASCAWAYWRLSVRVCTRGDNE